MSGGSGSDVDEASALIDRSSLVVAHNARFDRPFIERALPAARARPWACTRAEVPWTREGFASQALHCLACAYGVYARDRHRALADCEAGVWLLAQRLPVSGEPVLAALRRRALAPTVRLWAVRAPRSAKDALRARGYRWMPHTRCGIGRSWWTEVDPDALESEFAWLREKVYGPWWPYLPPGGLPHRPVSAYERWREDPVDFSQDATPNPSVRRRRGSLGFPRRRNRLPAALGVPDRCPGSSRGRTRPSGSAPSPPSAIACRTGPEPHVVPRCAPLPGATPKSPCAASRRRSLAKSEERRRCVDPPPGFGPGPVALRAASRLEERMEAPQRVRLARGRGAPAPLRPVNGLRNRPTRRRDAQRR